jgi:hypothetical protein
MFKQNDPTSTQRNWPLPPYAVFRCKAAAPFLDPTEFYYNDDSDTSMSFTSVNNNRKQSFRIVTGAEYSDSSPDAEMQEILVAVKSSGRIKETLMKRSGSRLKSQFLEIPESRSEREIR